MVDTKVPTIIFYASIEIGGGNIARKWTIVNKVDKRD